MSFVPYDASKFQVQNYSKEQITAALGLINQEDIFNSCLSRVKVEIYKEGDLINGVNLLNHPDDNSRKLFKEILINKQFILKGIIDEKIVYLQYFNLDGSRITDADKSVEEFKNMWVNQLYYNEVQSKLFKDLSTTNN